MIFPCIARPAARRRLLTLVAAYAGVAACNRGASPPPHGGSFTPDPTTVSVTGALCTSAKASEDLSPRAELMGGGGSVAAGPQVVHTSDLYVRFAAVCGGCHVDATNGMRHLDQNTFATTFDASWLAPIRSDDSKVFMPPPPNGKAFSSRQGNDPVLTLVTYLEAWLSAGRPADVFTIDAGTTTNAASSSSYMFTPDVAAAMTNLGNCVPNAAAYANSTSGMMESLDQFFAGATDLPPDLSDTDLTTFDSAVLAATGVIAYVPTYPLWSDGSGKLRHIRVPKGQSVKFNKDTQNFDIPSNTRFYKTFFRKVTDRTGQVRNRKMETRLIVARPDTTLPDGTTQQNALFGTYVWSDDETTATLANLPYRDGTTHADQVLTYITDELKEQNVVDSIGPGADFDAALADGLANTPGLQQHYAIPGRLRCVQCHMGSHTDDFVLGFFPLQIARRANGTGGTYEPTGDDELNQLERLIEYGVITGIDSPADVLTLEQSQGARKPRTDGELNAQAYMVGNCGHCHNPRGLPSITKPELASALVFYPDSDKGGIFEMPFDRMSPIRSRGANGDVPIPYITPSLYDYPVATYPDLVRMDTGASVDPNASGYESTWTPKYDPENLTCDAGVATSKALRAYCGSRTDGSTFVLAPWRSLIYRNVDSPFPYFDDYVPFPHMPMNTPGFDCRVPRIMGDWMVGLPAVRKSPKIAEDALPTFKSTLGDQTYDSSAQPYVEVKPDDPGYLAAQNAANDRLDAYHKSVRYNYCEDVLSPDIFDPITPASSPEYKPSPIGPGGYTLLGTPPDDPTRPGEYVQPPIGVPYHSHWFSYDTTDLPPPWSPRRADWQSVLVDKLPDTSLPAGGVPLSPDLVKSREILVDTLNRATLTSDLAAYATTEVPIGLWQVKPECQQVLALQKKVSDFPSGQRPAWMTEQNPAPDAPVYMSSPGATLYRHICFNCHGPKADGRGIQSDALSASSDGEARPANFHEGLFGPSSQPGANLLATFAVETGTDALLTWGARYMAWMALGGTLKRIPEDIIHLVEATRVLGVSRPNLQYVPAAKAASANMLNLAKGLCSVILPDPNGVFLQSEYTLFGGGAEPSAYPPFNNKKAPLIGANGDRELWLNLCTQYSPPVVHVYSVNAQIDGVDLTDLYYGDTYPADAPVLDHNKVVQIGLRPTVPDGNVHPPNYYPACLATPTDPAAVAWLADKPIRTKTQMPFCPAQFLSQATRLWTLRGSTDELQTYSDNIAKWEVYGGIATGMSVFKYLQSGGAQMTVKPYYNECQLLNK